MILLPSELFRIVTGCKIAYSSMKFKFIHKIFVIQEKFLVFDNVHWGPDITCSGPDPGRGLCIPGIDNSRGTRNAFDCTCMRWSSPKWSPQGNFVAPLLLFSVVSHYALLPSGVAGPPYTDCYPTAQSLLCGWSDGLEWSTGCAASDASSPLGSFSL